MENELLVFKIEDSLGWVAVLSQNGEKYDEETGEMVPVYCLSVWASEGLEGYEKAVASNGGSPLFEKGKAWAAF